MPKHGSQWMAHDGQLGDGAMDGSQWTARDGQLGDGAMEGLAMSRQSTSRASLEANGCPHRVSARIASPRQPPWSTISNKTHKTLTKHNFYLSTPVHFER